MWRHTRLVFLLFGTSLPLVLVSSPAEAYMGPGGEFTLRAGSGNLHRTISGVSA
jgi:hypothetical protein